MGIHSVRTRVTSRTRSGPCRSRARRASAFTRLMEQHGSFGMRHAVSGVGVPQIVVTIMLWRWSRLVKIWPSVPASCAAHALAGVAKLSTRASLPRAPARVSVSRVPSPPSTSSASTPSGPVEMENECVSASSTVSSGRSTRASIGSEMYASISRRSTSRP